MENELISSYKDVHIGSHLTETELFKYFSKKGIPKKLIKNLINKIKDEKIILEIPEKKIRYVALHTNDCYNTKDKVLNKLERELLRLIVTYTFVLIVSVNKETLRCNEFYKIEDLLDKDTNPILYKLITVNLNSNYFLTKEEYAGGYTNDYYPCYLFTEKEEGNNRYDKYANLAAYISFMGGFFKTDYFYSVFKFLVLQLPKNSSFEYSVILEATQNVFGSLTKKQNSIFKKTINKLISINYLKFDEATALYKLKKGIIDEDIDLNDEL